MSWLSNMVSKPADAISGVFGMGPQATTMQNSLTNTIQPVDPRLQALVDQENQQAQAFQQNLPTYEQDQFSVASNNIKQQGAQTSQNITENANNRGLLYSGLNSGAQQANLGNEATGLANAKASINQGAQNTASSLNQSAIGASEGLLGAQNAQSSSNYQAQLAGYNARMQALGGAAQAAGGIGTAAGLLLL